MTADLKSLIHGMSAAQVATAQAAHDARQLEIDGLRRQIATMRAALEQCEEYLDNRADADGDSEGFRPNAEMSLLIEVRAALSRVQEGR